MGFCVSSGWCDPCSVSWSSGGHSSICEIPRSLHPTSLAVRWLYPIFRESEQYRMNQIWFLSQSHCEKWFWDDGSWVCSCWGVLGVIGRPRWDSVTGLLQRSLYRSTWSSLWRILVALPSQQRMCDLGNRSVTIGTDWLGSVCCSVVCWFVFLHYFHFQHQSRWRKMYSLNFTSRFPHHFPFATYG